MRTSDRLETIMNTTATRRGLLAGSAALTIGAGLPSPARAQAYPAKPINIITGFAPGGPADLIARIVGAQLQAGLKQPSVIEGKTGAAGNASVEFVAKAAPDGHTLLVSSIPAIVINPHTYASLPYSPVTDLEHITMLCEGDFVLVAPTAVGAKTWAEFVDIAKKNPGKLNYGTTGAGGNLHVYSEAMKLQAGISLQPVHYRGAALIMPDLLTNQVQMLITTYPVLAEHIAAGKLQPLLIVGKTKEPQLPNVPTATEVGLQGFDRSMNWLGLHAPKRTPKPVIDIIYAQIESAMKTDSYRKQIVERGFAPVGDTPQQFAARIQSDYAFFGEVVKKAGVKIE